MIALRPLREDEYGAWDAAHRAEYRRYRSLGWSEESVHMRKNL